MEKNIQLLKGRIEELEQMIAAMTSGDEGKHNLELCLTDLESGEFAQDWGYLRTRKGYCCLGVICDRYQRETGQGEWKQSSNSALPTNYVFVLNGKAHSGFLPDAVQEWLGLDTPSIMLPTAYPGATTEGSATAVGWNDSGASFPEIAAAIRSHYLTGSRDDA